MRFVQKTIIITAALLIACFFICVVIIQPTMDDIEAFNDRIEMERASLENKYTNRRNVKNVIADLKYVSDALNPLFEKIIVQEGGEAAFISGLEKLAKNNNLIQKIQISAAGPTELAEKDKFAQKRNITISLSGDYIETLKYLSDLEKSEMYIIITDITIASGKTQTASAAASSGTVKTNLQSYVYFSI